MCSFIALNGTMVVQLKNMDEPTIENFVVIKVYVTTNRLSTCDICLGQQSRNHENL